MLQGFRVGFSGQISQKRNADETIEAFLEKMLLAPSAFEKNQKKVSTLKPCNIETL
jgi:hypothetical protein